MNLRSHLTNDLRSRVTNCPRWVAVLAPIVAYVFVDAFVDYLQTGWPTIATDPAFFQHTGWYILQGGVPYVDVWDVNPPIPFAITTVLAALSGGNMLVLHGLSVTLTVLVAASSVMFVGWVAYMVTGEDAAAVAAGLTMLVVPVLFIRAPEGVRAQYYALFFGVLALVVVLRDRPFLAGAAAAMSAGSWQSGGAFALLIVGMAYQRNGRTGALSAIAGGGVVAGLVLLVFGAAGALVAMVVQTVRAPLIAGSTYTLAERVYMVLLVFGYGSLLLPVAFFGWAHAAVRDLRERWWVPAGGVLLGLQVLFVDMDGSTDAFLWLAFVALGVALTVERAIEWRFASTDRRDHEAIRSNARQWAVLLAVVVLVVPLIHVGPIWYHGSPSPKPTLQTLHDDAEAHEDPLPVTPDDGDVPSMQTIYWEKMEPETCHYRLSWNEARWISRTDDRLDATDCSGWPSRTDSG